MEFLPFLVPILLPFFWVLIVWIISKAGWQKLVDRYGTEPALQGERLGWVSLTIGLTTYNNAIALRYDHHGIYLQPLILFRLFHKPVFIPWKEITVKDYTAVLFKMKELSIGEPQVARVVLSKSKFSKLPGEYLNRQRQELNSS